MKFDRIVIHFEDGKRRKRRAIITKNSKVGAIFLSESAVRKFLAGNSKKARLARPAPDLVQLVNGRGKDVPMPDAAVKAKPLAPGEVPKIPRGGDGPGVWYDAPGGVLCW